MKAVTGVDAIDPGSSVSRSPAGANEVWLEPDGALTPGVEDDRTSEILPKPRPDRAAAGGLTYMPMAW